MAEYNKIRGNIAPILSSDDSRYPHLYKVPVLSDDWYFSVYSNYHYDYENDDEYSHTNGMNFFKAMFQNGWKKPQIAAMLGNMCQESTLNCGMWEHAKGGTAPIPANDYSAAAENQGFGLVQWTPASKLCAWSNAVFGSGDLQYPYWYSGSVQVARIMWELENGGQWNSANPLGYKTFREFYDSDVTDIGSLCACFFFGYEQAGQTIWNATGQTRVKYALQWAERVKAYIPTWLIIKAAEGDIL